MKIGVRQQVEKSLGKIGVAAVELLIVTLKDEKIWVRRSAAKILGEIRDKRALVPLRELLKEKNSISYEDGTVGDIAKEAIQKIKSAQKEKNKE